MAWLPCELPCDIFIRTNINVVHGKIMSNSFFDLPDSHIAHACAIFAIKRILEVHSGNDSLLLHTRGTKLSDLSSHWSFLLTIACSPSRAQCFW